MCSLKGAPYAPIVTMYPNRKSKYTLLLSEIDDHGKYNAQFMVILSVQNSTLGMYLCTLLLHPDPTQWDSLLCPRGARGLVARTPDLYSEDLGFESQSGVFLWYSLSLSCHTY